MVAILEAGLQAADPYTHARQLLRVEGNRLVVGHPLFEPAGAPRTGEEVFDLTKINRIFVFGAGKGVQRIALAIEETLGDRLTGGHVIGKHGDDIICSRIGVTLGGHPVPDQYCVIGCHKILAMCQGMTESDLVFTIGCNGISSLLTMPAPGLSIEDVAHLTYLMQIDRGAPTSDLNAVRNHVDVMKSGRVTRHFQPAAAIHIMGIDPSTWDWIMTENRWQHFLPDCTTFADAIAMLRKWDAWDAVAESIRRHLLRADPEQETVKAHEFLSTRARVFGVMPRQLSSLPAAMRAASGLGFSTVKLASFLRAEASQAGLVIADIALTCEREGVPFQPPCALFSSGEILVTVGQATGVGGRNQEYALAAAERIAGSRNIVMGGVDTDGTDGPGGHFSENATAAGIRNLCGGIVDGETAAEATARGIDIVSELKQHNSSAVLWTLQSGIAATHNVSIGDLSVTLIMGRSAE